MTLPRFYPILDTHALAQRDLAAPHVAEALLEGGARILQFRHKGPLTRAAFADAQAVAERARAAGALLVMNDRADLAALLGAALHVGQDDLPPVDARRVLGTGLALGLSTHNAEQMRAAAEEPVDYVALGPVYGTSSKVNPDPVVGLDGLRACRSLTARPLVAIGGITQDTATAALAAGADSVAVIGDLLPADNCSVATIRTRAAEWVRITQD